MRRFRHIYTFLAIGAVCVLSLFIWIEVDRSDSGSILSQIAGNFNNAPGSERSLSAENQRTNPANQTETSFSKEVRAVDPQPRATPEPETATPYAPIQVSQPPPATSTVTPTQKPPEPEITPVGQQGKWRLIFNDEFEGESLDTSKWTTCYWWDENGCTIVTNNEMEWYQPDNVAVRDGALYLQAKKQNVRASNGRNYSYTSGMISTGRNTSDRSQPARFTFQYGYAEIRARVPRGKGLWPAFWMLPENHDSKPEIDVMEILGHAPETIEMHYHYVDENGNVARTGGEWVGTDYSSDWHTYAIDWQPDQLIWYVDGVERWRFSDAAHIPALPMYMLLNLAVGGDWPGKPNAETQFPSNYELDYVRVWQRANQAYLAPVADTFVDSSKPKESFGAKPYLFSDGSPTKKTYLKFDTTGLSQRKIASAVLRLSTTTDPGAGSESTHIIKVLEDTRWQEESLTFDNQPAMSNTILGTIDHPISIGVAYLIPLDINLLQPYIGSVFSLVIESSGPDGLYINSRESYSAGIQLLLTFAEK